ncbi:sugar transferase [Providencia rettgeri]
MKILVTGGGGFIGSAVVRHIINNTNDAMNLKLQYDFYYIKHFSFWLDVLVVLKTIRTIVTGNIGSNTAR